MEEKEEEEGELKEEKVEEKESVRSSKVLFSEKRTDGTMETEQTKIHTQ